MIQKCKNNPPRKSLHDWVFLYAAKWAWNAFLEYLYSSKFGRAF